MTNKSLHLEDGRPCRPGPTRRGGRRHWSARGRGRGRRRGRHRSRAMTVIEFYWAEIQVKVLANPGGAGYCPIPETVLPYNLSGLLKSIVSFLVFGIRIVIRRSVKVLNIFLGAPATTLLVLLLLLV